MSRPSKTGGGPGTNQYQVRGQAKRRPKTVHGYPADQVIERGECIWLHTGVDDARCLKHRQLAPEVRQMVGLPMCVTRLTPEPQLELVLYRPLRAVTPGLGQLHARVRLQVVQMAPPGFLQWATQDPDPQVRQVAVKRMPVEQLQWAAQDKDWRVRLVAARRMPLDQLQWATKDEDEDVRHIAVERMPPEQLGRAAKDPDGEVRELTAKRIPKDQLQWATKDEDEVVRQVAAKRMSPEQLGWATKDKDEEVRRIAARRRVGRASKPRMGPQ